MDLIKTLFRIILLGGLRTGQELPTWIAVYEYAASRLAELAVRPDERIWTDEETYELFVQFVGTEPSSSQLYDYNQEGNYIGLCCTEQLWPMYEATMPESAMAWANTHLRGKIHYYPPSLADNIWVFAQMMCSTTPTTGVVDRWIEWLLAHERQHAVQDLAFVQANCTVGSVNDPQYNEQAHERDANLVALETLRYLYGEEIPR